MKLLEALKHAGRHLIVARYSLFHVSATGVYTSLHQTTDAAEMVERFKTESVKPETVGLEVRCDGQRVQFDGT